MAMRDCRGSMNPIKKLFGRLIGEAQRHWNDAHERTIAVAILIIAACNFGTHTIRNARQSATSRDANIEHSSMRSP